MHDSAWLDDDDGQNPTSPRRARPLLITLAALPWLVVIALFVVPDAPPAPGATTAEDSDATGGTSPRVGPADTAAVDEADDPEASGSDTPGSTASPTDTTRDRSGPPDHGDAEGAGQAEGAGHDADVELDPAAGSGADAPSTRAAPDPDVAAVALLVARHWLSGADQRDDALGLPVLDTTEYAEHLHLEGLEGDEDLLVARVVALQLAVDDARAPRLRRIAVPLAATEDGPRLLGEPWELPTPTLDTAALSTQTLTDPVLTDAAEQALRDAGVGAPRIRRLARTSGWPLVVTFTSEQHDEEQQAWLRAEADGLALAGLHLPPDPVPRRPGGAADPRTDAGDPS